MLRVLTWNIRIGGRDGPDPCRLAQVIQVVTEQRPDVLAVQGLRGPYRVRLRPHPVVADLDLTFA